MGFRCCAGDSGARFSVRVVEGRAILYVCSKVVCFLVTWLVVRSRCWACLVGFPRRCR